MLGPIAQRNALSDKLDALGVLPRLAEDAGERRVRAQRTLDEAQHERARLEREIGKKQERLAELVVPENLLGVSAEAIEKLRDRVGKFRAAEEDLPRRHEDARRHEAELERVAEPALSRASLDGFEAQRPSPTELSGCASCPNVKRRCSSEWPRCQKSLRGLDRAARASGRKFGRFAAPRELGVQRRVLASARANGDVERRARDARSLSEKLELQAAAKLSALGFWRGSLSALPGLELPSEETVERFQREFAELASRSSRAFTRARLAFAAARPNRAEDQSHRRLGQRAE